MVAPNPPLKKPPMTTNVKARQEVLGPGLSIAPRVAPEAMGTLGCIIRTTGRLNRQVVPGKYLLTNYHVARDTGLGGNDHGDGTMIQPAITNLWVPPADADRCGRYVYGVKDPENDCAICSLDWRRTASNDLPKRDWKFNHKKIRGVARARAGDVVYIFGAATGYSKGVVDKVNHVIDQGGICYRRVMLIKGQDGNRFCGPGDSGSVVIRKRDDTAVGLLFLEDQQDHSGLAYDLQSQLDHFRDLGGSVTLV